MAANLDAPALNVNEARPKTEGGQGDSRAAPRVAGVGGGIPAVGYIGTTESGRSGWVRKTGHMETFNKRQKEMRRLERQKDKEARRILRKQYRADAASDTSSQDASQAGGDGSPAVEPITDVKV